jgi:thioredoxin 1
MNKVSNYLPSISSIDWKKEAKETFLPAAAGLAAGAVINCNNPTAFAVGYIAKESFSKPWLSCLLMANAKLTKTMNQNFPSFESKTLLTRGIAMIALNIAAPLYVGYKISQYAGYEISPYGLFIGSSIGFLANRFVKQRLQEDPFKGSEIVTVNKENFQKEVLESELPVVLDAYATWCPPCRAMAPIFTAISKEMSGKVKFVKFNIDEDSALAGELEVSAVPTFIFFKDGKPQETLQGGLAKDAFVDKINHMIQS